MQTSEAASCDWLSALKEGLLGEGKEQILSIDPYAPISSTTQTPSITYSCDNTSDIWSQRPCPLESLFLSKKRLGPRFSKAVAVFGGHLVLPGRRGLIRVCMGWNYSKRGVHGRGGTAGQTHGKVPGNKTSSHLCSGLHFVELFHVHTLLQVSHNIMR